jgi:rubrerythrin
MDYEQEEPRPIDANALLKKLEPYKGWQFHEAIDAAIEAVKQAPTLDLTFTGYGKWKAVKGYQNRRECSECGFTGFMGKPFPYCPQCGAQMEDENAEG